MIYVERDRWEQGSWKAAPYHLERAVSKTQQSEGRRPDEYQPLPHLTKLYADGLKKHNGDPNKIRKLYVNAAKGYLDLDDLAQTDYLLTKAQNSAERPLLEETPMKSILAARTTIRDLKVDSLEPQRMDEFVAREITNLSPVLDAMSPEFLHRQRAKIYLEVGQKIYKSDGVPEERARKFQMKSLSELSSSPVVTSKEINEVLRQPAKSTSITWRMNSWIIAIGSERTARLGSGRRCGTIRLRRTRMPVWTALFARTDWAGS